MTGLAADFGSYRFDNWTTDKGLPQNSVLSIIQSHDGYLWFTTFDGLVRFDGVSFTVFNKNNSPGFSNNRLICVFEDSDGAIWSGAENGGVTRYKSGKFQTYNSENGLPSKNVTKIQQSPDGKIIVSSNDNFYYLGSSDEKQFKPFEMEDPAIFRKIYWSRSGTRWLFGSSMSEIRDEKTINYPISLKDGAGFYEDAAGALWIGEGAVFYRLKDGEIIRFDQHGKMPVKEGITLKVPNQATYVDSQGLIWSGGVRLAILNPQTGKIAEIPPADNTTLISDIIGDREGNVWLGTNGHGLTRASRKFMSTYSTQDGMKTENIYPVFEDRSQNVWIGAGGISKISDEGIVNIDSYTSVTNDSPQSFYEDHEGCLWIGGYNSLARYKDGKFTDLSGTFGHRTFVAIYEDRSGNVWLGTNNGLIKFRDGFKTFYTTENGLPSKGINDIYEDAGGTLWLATSEGLAKFKNNAFTAFTDRDGLAGNYVRTLTGESDGTLWIGTYDNGLSRLKNGKFTNYSTVNGLFNNGVFRILDDGHGYFWMSCNRGIYRVSKQQLNDYADGKIPAITSVAYGREDGMLSTECNGGRQPAGLKAHDGRLWFPTQKGVVVVDPAAVAFNYQAPPVVIESVKIDNKPIELGNLLRIEPGQSIVQIDYAGLSLIKSEQVHFKYKIEGLDADWIDAGTRRSAFYSYLPAGDYVFTVIASNADGVWNETGAGLKIQVLPPFWKTWWFFVLVILISLSAGYMFYRRRTLQLLRGREAQELMSRRLIESQEAERKRLAGELHDSLSQNLVIIKNRAMMSLADRQNTESAYEQIEEIADAASETLAEVREIAYNLRPFQIDRLGLTEAIEVMIKKISSSNLQIESKLDRIDNLLSPELEINFYRIVQESLSNIVKHSQASEAKVTIDKNEQFIQLSIEDNGRGFEAGTIKLNDSSNKNLGFGILGIYERSRILGCVPQIKSSKENGTAIFLNIPLK